MISPVMIGASVFAGLVMLMCLIAMSHDEAVIIMVSHHMDRKVKRIDAEDGTGHDQSKTTGPVSTSAPPLH